MQGGQEMDENSYSYSTVYLGFSMLPTFGRLVAQARDFSTNVCFTLATGEYQLERFGENLWSEL